MSGIHGPGRRTNRSMPRRLICTRELVKRKIRRDRDDKHRCDENQGQVAKCNHVHQEHCRRRKMTERTLRAWRPSLATVQAEGDLLDHESLIIENSMHVTLGVSLSDFVHLRIEPSSKALWSSTKREISRRDHRRRLVFLSLTRAVHTVYLLMSPAKLSQRPNSHHHQSRCTNDEQDVVLVVSFVSFRPASILCSIETLWGRNDLNCGAWDSEYNQQLNSQSRVLNLLGGGCLETSSVRVLVVDDNEPFRRFVCSTLEHRPDLQVVGEASDGLVAVHKAQELQPDLIVLDIGLPRLNGIEAARRIRKFSCESKILFVSQESSVDVVQEALRLGALGYVIKTHAGSDLLAAVEAISRGRQFISSGFSGHICADPTDTQALNRQC